MARYAAYATNLDPDLMRERCPHSPVEGMGWLSGWRLTFGGEDLGWEGSLATIVQDPRSRVYVMLYDVSHLDEKVLDEWEGATPATGGRYDKLRVRVSMMDGEVLAWTYVLNAYEGGLPSCRYLGQIIEAADKAGAPEDYLADLRSRPCAPASSDG